MDLKGDPFKDGEPMRTRRSKTIQQSSTPSLPEEVISVILIKLPVKSLLRFKSVCKSWRDLISDPIFINAHLQGNIQDKDHARRRLIIKTSYPHFDLQSCSISSVMNGESPITGVDYQWEYPPQSIRIIGSINGLVCISMLTLNAYIFIWNPSTGKAKRLPHFGSDVHAEQIVSYGFGYDEASNDYKVVIIYHLGSGIEWTYMPAGKIYGLKSDSWSPIKNLYKNTQMCPLCTYVSGSLNWEAAGGVIVSFDLSNETWSVISRPTYLNEEWAFWGLNIGNLDGNLCQLFYVDDGMMRIDLWVMKEFGKVESWSKMYSIPYLCDIDTFRYSASLIFSGKNKVLMLIGSFFMLYNLETKTVTHLEIQYLSDFLDVATYIESLVSFDGAINSSVVEVTRAVDDIIDRNC